MNVHFAWQAWDFMALKRKLPLGALMFTQRAVYEQSEKVMRCTCESAFAWQVWDFAALKRKLLRGSLMFTLRAVNVESEKR